VIELSLAAMIRSTLLKMHKFEEIEFNRPCHERRREGRNEIVRRNSKSFARDEFTQLDRISEHNYYCLEDSFTDAERRRSLVRDS